MSEYTELTPMVSDDNPDVLFRDIDDNFLNVSSVNVNNGEITSVVVDGELIEEFTFEKYLLHIPGLGYVTPGTRIIYKEHDYVLNFGWHTNSSNQTIYSWNLESLDDNIPPKTVYKEMIDEFNLVHFN